MILQKVRTALNEIGSIFDSIIKEHGPGMSIGDLDLLVKARDVSVGGPLLALQRLVSSTTDPGVIEARATYFLEQAKPRILEILQPFVARISRYEADRNAEILATLLERTKEIVDGVLRR
jgi:hypothetical protein